MAETNSQGTMGQAIRKDMEKNKDVSTDKGKPAEGAHTPDMGQDGDDIPTGSAQTNAEHEGMG